MALPFGALFVFLIPAAITRLRQSPSVVLIAYFVIITSPISPPQSHNHKFRDLIIMDILFEAVTRPR